MKQKSGRRGAVIVEASLALPFFMFAVYTMLSVVQIAYAQARVAVALDSATKQAAQYMHVYFALGLDETFTGEGGKSSELMNNLSGFLEEMGEGVGNVSQELGQYVDEAGQSLQGDSLVAYIQDGLGSLLVEQMLYNNLADGPGDTAEAFMRRNHILSLNMNGSKFLEAGEGSSGRDIFMRVNYEIQVVDLLGLDIRFPMSHCAYAQAWAGVGE